MLGEIINTHEMVAVIIHVKLSYKVVLKVEKNTLYIVKCYTAALLTHLQGADFCNQQVH